MPDLKISQLTQLTTPDDADYLPIVDVSDLSMAASGTTKRINKSDLVVAAGPTGAAGGELAGTYPNPRLAQYRNILRAATRANQGTVGGSGTWGLTIGGAVAGLSAAGPVWASTYLQPTDWAAAGYTTKLRLLVGCLVNDIAPANTMTFGLYPITAVTGGANLSIPALGTVIAGSTVAFVTPAANSMTAETSSGDFNFPAAGWYMLCVVSSAGLPTNCNIQYSYALQVRNV